VSKLNLNKQVFRSSRQTPLGDQITTVIFWDAEGVRRESITIETVNHKPAALRTERHRNWPSKENPR